MPKYCCDDKKIVRPFRLTVSVSAKNTFHSHISLNSEKDGEN